ncbi:MAG: response regulator transcription factor [Anaerolineales bacterium]|jgi:DNA-binding response OmpR family regulator
MDPLTVLFAEDDAETRELVNILLGQKNFKMIGVSNGQEAIDVLERQGVDLVILDVMMPVLDGLTTLRHIRQTSNMPVILLTAKDQEDDILAGFAAGASDYVTKPFRPAELVARVQSRLLSDQETRPLGILKYQDLQMDLKRREVTCQGKSLDLTRLEYQLLLCFMQRPGEVLSKEQLLRAVWGYQGELPDLNLVEAVVVRLRKKIKVSSHCPEFIHTVRGVGYRFGVEGSC